MGLRGKLIAGGLVVAALVVAAPFAWREAERVVRPGHAVLAVVSAGSVRVALADERDAAGQEWLLGTFTPEREGFHLYSTALPLEGIGGVGRPTRMEIVSRAVLAASGPAAADRPATMLYAALLGDSFPVYPAGPVTLRLPVRRLGEERRVTVALTYMACNENTCLAPVVGREVALRLPR